MHGTGGTGCHCETERVGGVDATAAGVFPSVTARSTRRRDRTGTPLHSVRPLVISSLMTAGGGGHAGRSGEGGGTEVGMGCCAVKRGRHGNSLERAGAASGSAFGGTCPIMFPCSHALLSLSGDSRLAAILQQLANHATANAGPLGAVPLSGSQLAAGGLSSEPSSHPTLRVVVAIIDDWQVRPSRVR